MNKNHHTIINAFRLSKARRRVVGLGLALCTSSYGAVPVGDVTLVPVVSDNLPVFYSLTGYANRETRLRTDRFHQFPLFKPYENDQADWWDNIVAEQLQARMPAMMMATRGAEFPTNPNDFSGSMNPYQLVRLTAAFDRAGIDQTMMKVTCFVDTQPCKKHYQKIVGGTSATLVNFADRANVVKCYWDHCIKPWFATIPRERWFNVKMGTQDRPLIQFWSFHPSWAINMNNNVSAMLTGVADKFQATHGVRPCFNMPVNLIDSGNQDASVASHPDIYGFNDWFSPETDQSWTVVARNGRNVGHMIPGYAHADYYNANEPGVYLNPDDFISRKGSNGGGANGDTLLEGLNAAMLQNVDVMSVEGWTDDVEYAGLYRSLDNQWNTPNQYINLMRRYNDLRTETLRLELEGCDAFSDTTPGNAGTKFRRSGDLDIQDKPDGNGWSVGWTAAGEWMEFRNVYLAPGTYVFPLNYAADGGKIVTLSIGGSSLGPVTLPSSGGTTTYDTHSLGTATVTGGEYTIRLTTNTSSGLNLDWLFIKRKNTSASFKSLLNNKLARALSGGGDEVRADRDSAGNHEKFIICDQNGGSLVSGDFVNLQCHNGLFFSATGGGNQDLQANRMSNGGWERFEIRKVSGTGVITAGTEVVLKSSSGYFINVTSQGLLDVKGTSTTNSTKFVIGF